MYAESLEPTIIPLPTGKKQVYEIDGDQLFWLREKKLVKRGSALDIFFCLQLSYGSSTVNIDVPSFCQRWGLSEAEVLGAIASLQKKELLEPTIKQLELKFDFD